MTGRHSTVWIDHVRHRHKTSNEPCRPAFTIFISILVDIAVQLNVWRVGGVSGMRAQELGNKVLPGLGWFLAVLVFIGGVVFNIGNIAGTGLGANAMMGLDPKIGGAISTVIAILIFLSKRAGMAPGRVRRPALPAQPEVLSHSPL